MYCRKCGTKQEEGQKFCSKCGTPYSVSMNSKRMVQNKEDYNSIERYLLDTGNKYLSSKILNIACIVLLVSTFLGVWLLLKVNEDSNYTMLAGASICVLTGSYIVIFHSLMLIVYKEIERMKELAYIIICWIPVFALFVLSTIGINFTLGNKERDIFLGGIIVIAYLLQYVFTLLSGIKLYKTFLRNIGVSLIVYSSSFLLLAGIFFMFQNNLSDQNASYVFAVGGLIYITSFLAFLFFVKTLLVNRMDSVINKK